MPCNFVADGFQIKKLCNRLSSSSAILQGNSRFAFLSPIWGLGATYYIHVRLIGKRVVDFILVLIELYSLVLPLRRYERISTENLKIGNFAPTGRV